jgi:hypothetical protein
MIARKSKKSVWDMNFFKFLKFFRIYAIHCWIFQNTASYSLINVNFKSILWINSCSQFLSICKWCNDAMMQWCNDAMRQFHNTFKMNWYLTLFNIIKSFDFERFLSFILRKKIVYKEKIALSLQCKQSMNISYNQQIKALYSVYYNLIYQCFAFSISFSS